MKPGAYLLASVVLLGACGVGDEGENPPPEANPNGLRCSVGIKVSGSFTESATNPRPLDPLGPDGQVGTADDNTEKIGGCWPVGDWQFTATVDPAVLVPDITGDGTGDVCGDVAGTTPPAFEASYSFRVTRTEDPVNDGLVESYQYLGSSPNFFTVKVTEGGTGDCEAIMEFKSPDAKSWWTFNPEICTSDNCTPVSNTVSGGGDFTQYLESQPY